MLRTSGDPARIWLAVHIHPSDVITDADPNIG